nr:retrovirus-related Pol polyprotein from transposon TNT 1-94 [Tanacetum cinerariifolium]
MHKESIIRTVPVETPASAALVSCDGLGGYDWSNQAEEGPTNFALMAYSSTSSNFEVFTDSNYLSSCLENTKILKEQNEQLLIDLRTSKINAITYKTGLESIEARLLVYKKDESVYEEDIKIVDKCKTSLGYNAVPPPYNGNFLPLKPELYGLEKFVNEPIVSEPTVKKLVVETCKAKASADKPKDVRKIFGPPLIEDWISDSEDESELKPKIEKKTVTPSFAKIEFVKSKKQVKSPKKITVKQGYVAFGGNPKGGKITRKARTPQQNRVAERRNRTLIEAARTMLADSKLPTTFWAEAANTTCYVQNRVLVVKPHNKTPYELFHGRILALSFMKPFRCHVTILNTKDYLGKFDGKADEGLFVGYFLNSKTFRVFNNRTKIVEENLHIRFQPLSDDGKKVDKDPKQESKCKDQEKEDNVNKNNIINAVGTNEINAVSANINNELPFDLEMPALEDMSTFNFLNDHENDDEMADMNNLDTKIQVSPTPTTRIYKDHPIDQVIGDMHSTTQTRNMSKNLEEHWFVITIH